MGVDDVVTAMAAYLGVEDGELDAMQQVVCNSLLAPLPYGWEEYKDGSGSPYYYHADSETSTYENPNDALFRDIIKAKRSGAFTALGWSLQWADNGRPYFHRGSTGESQWTLPDSTPSMGNQIADKSAQNPSSIACDRPASGAKSSGASTSITGGRYGSRQSEHGHLRRMSDPIKRTGCKSAKRALLFASSTGLVQSPAKSPPVELDHCASEGPTLVSKHAVRPWLTGLQQARTNKRTNKRTKPQPIAASVTETHSLPSKDMVLAAPTAEQLAVYIAGGAMQTAREAQERWQERHPTQEHLRQHRSVSAVPSENCVAGTTVCHGQSQWSAPELSPTLDANSRIQDQLRRHKSEKIAEYPLSIHKSAVSQVNASKLECLSLSSVDTQRTSSTPHKRTARLSYIAERVLQAQKKVPSRRTSSLSDGERATVRKLRAAAIRRERENIVKRKKRQQDTLFAAQAAAAGETPSQTAARQALLRQTDLETTKTSRRVVQRHLAAHNQLCTSATTAELRVLQKDMLQRGLGYNRSTAGLQLHAHAQLSQINHRFPTEINKALAECDILPTKKITSVSPVLYTESEKRWILRQNFGTQTDRDSHRRKLLQNNRLAWV